MCKGFKKKNIKSQLLIQSLKNLNLINKDKIDVIFNALHGKDGEDGIAQSFFEYLKIPYTHSGVISSYSAMNKIISKEIFIKNKIPTPKYFTIKKNEISISKLKRLINKSKIKFPIVIKPNNEGSSLGVKIVKNIDQLIKTSKQLFKKYTQLIFEKFIGGQEIQVAVLNNVALGAIELNPEKIIL